MLLKILIEEGARRRESEKSWKVKKKEKVCKVECFQRSSASMISLELFAWPQLFSREERNETRTWATKWKARMEKKNAAKEHEQVEGEGKER